MTYDSMGRVVTQTYPDGEVVTHTYNAGGNLETMSGASSYVTNVDYNEYGKITNFAFGNGKTTIYAYNNLNGRMTDLDVAGVLDNHYTYDLVGNITHKDDILNTAYNETFGYDELYRLTSAQGYYGAKAYTYDAYGNITSKDGMLYSYPAVGGVQPHAVTSDGTNTYAYDANGNMTTGKGRTLTYDTENRVTQITKDGVTTTMGYDDSGERITKTVGNVVSVYWFGSYEERYTSGSLSEATKYYSANGQPVAQRSTVSGLLFIHRDHLGSVSKLTNASGVVVQTMEYIPYGTKTYASGGEYTDYGYTGQENDPSTGLYYFHARYYDPELGRFMQADTVLDGVNRYTYCGNNPVMYTDPSGEFIFSAFIPVIGPILDAACWGAVIGAAAGAATNAAVQGVNILSGKQNTFDWGNFWTATGNGAICGAISGTVAGVIGLLGGTSGIAGSAGGSAVTLYGQLPPQLQILTYSSNGVLLQQLMNPLVYIPSSALGLTTGGIVASLLRPMTDDPMSDLLNVVNDAINSATNLDYGQDFLETASNNFESGDYLCGTVNLASAGMEAAYDRVLETGKKFVGGAAALIDLAKFAKKLKGITFSDALTLIGWAREYGVVPSRGPEIHENRDYDGWHIRIGPINHIDVK